MKNTSIVKAITIIDDTAVESDETFSITLTLTDDSGESLGAETATVTIIDNDVPVTVSDVVVAEYAGSVSLAVEWNPEDILDEVVRFNYSTSDGTATAVFDYTETSDFLSVANAGGLKLIGGFPIINDPDLELYETFTVTVILTDISGEYAFGSDTATVTIIDDDL
jgi:hypothetical protein